MKKRLQKLCVAAVLVACLSTFGAWTYPDTPQEIRYGDFDLLSTYATETINYTYKDDSVQNTTDGNVPRYMAVDGLTDACGAVAGAIAVGYYDKYAPNLIEGWTSHFATGKYRAQDRVYVPAVIHELYTKMGTASGGVTENGFLNGLRQYAAERNYTATFTKVGTSNSLNFAACKDAIDNNKIIALLADAGNVYSMACNTNVDYVETMNIPSPHIMIAYGYMQVNYYNVHGLFRTDTYLRAFVTSQTQKALYYKITPHNLTSAYVMDIG